MISLLVIEECHNCAFASFLFPNTGLRGLLPLTHLSLQAQALSKALDLAEQCKDREFATARKLEGEREHFMLILEEQMLHHQRHKNSLKDILAETQSEGLE